MNGLGEIVSALVGIAVGGGAAALLATVAIVRVRTRSVFEPNARAEALLRASGTALGRAVIQFEDRVPRLVAGEGTMTLCAAALGRPAGDAATVIAALEEASPEIASALVGLMSHGTPFDLTARGAAGSVRIIGGAAGSLVLVSLAADRPSPGPQVEGGLAVFLDAYPAPAMIVGVDGRARFVNRAWPEAIGEGDRFGLELAQQALAEGAARERVRWVGKPGGRQALRFRAEPLTNNGAVVLSWDATAAESAAEGMARSDAALALILGETTDAVAIFGTDQRLAYYNPAFARLWQLEPAWLAEAPSHAALLDRLRQARRLPEVVDYARFRAEELARHERTGPAPETIWRIAGERILRVLSLPHPNGGLILVISDITPEVRLKSQFNHLIQVQQATLDKLTDAVAVFGPDARLKLHNEAFSQLWTIPAETLAGEPAFDDIVDRCIARLHDMHFWTELKGRITDPDPGVRAPVRGEARTADGRQLAWQSRPLPDGATLVSFVDVTDARRLEGALRDRETALAGAEQLKQDFVGSVSYELRTPLTTILGYAELLETGDQGLSERARAWVTAVRAAASDLARLVEDILAFAEIDAGEMTLRLARTDVPGLLSEVAARWRARAEESAIDLEVDIGVVSGSIEADGASLARVLDHLIDHALRQTPRGGRVRLSATRAHGEVCLEVSDTGRGIPFHIQAHIFDRFRGEEGSGSSLGLALVKALVELHGGWVAVESEPGVGTSFACHLPETGQEPATTPL